MSSAAKDIESKVQFWSLIGPLSIACILLIIILRSATSTLLPVVAVTGVFICYRWKWAGLAAALGCLVAAFGLQFTFSTSIDWLWFSILALSIASAFILTALSFDQSAHAFEAVEDQSDRYKETINQLDERLTAFQEKLLQERQEFHVRIQQLGCEITEHKDKILASEKAVMLARDDLTNQEEHQRRLLQELYEMRQYAHQLELQLSTACYSPSTPEVEHEVDPFASSASVSAPNTDSNAEVIAKYEAEAVTMRHMLEETETRYRKCLQDQQEQANELANLKDLHEVFTRSSVAAEEQQIVQQAIVQELNDHIENLTREKQLLESTLVRLQSELEALIVQEEGQTQTLADNRQTITRLQSSLGANESALASEIANFKSYKIAAEGRERDLVWQVEELTRKWAGVSQQIGDWQRKLEDYQQLRDKAIKLQQNIESLVLEKNHLHSEVKDLESRLIDSEKGRVDALNEVQEYLKTAQEIAAQEQAAKEDEEPQVSEVDREVRRWAGLYNQLKEQFADKSMTLDVTRKELFQVQEQLYVLQREALEKETYSEDMTSKGMSQLLGLANEELHDLEQNYRREIEQLQDLVKILVVDQQTAGVR